jgi:hypothetical protein
MPDAAAFKMRRRGRLNARIVIRGGEGLTELMLHGVWKLCVVTVIRNRQLLVVVGVHGILCM